MERDHLGRGRRGRPRRGDRPPSRAVRGRDAWCPGRREARRPRAFDEIDLVPASVDRVVVREGVVDPDPVAVEPAVDVRASLRVPGEEEPPIRAGIGRTAARRVRERGIEVGADHRRHRRCERFGDREHDEIDGPVEDHFPSRLQREEIADPERRRLERTTATDLGPAVAPLDERHPMGVGRLKGRRPGQEFDRRARVPLGEGTNGACRGPGPPADRASRPPRPGANAFPNTLDTEQLLLEPP